MTSETKKQEPPAAVQHPCAELGPSRMTSQTECLGRLVGGGKGSEGRRGALLGEKRGGEEGKGAEGVKASARLGVCSLFKSRSICDFSVLKCTTSDVYGT